jgi:hypothetical protein
LGVPYTLFYFYYRYLQLPQILLLLQGLGLRLHLEQIRPVEILDPFTSGGRGGTVVSGFGVGVSAGVCVLMGIEVGLAVAVAIASVGNSAATSTDSELVQAEDKTNITIMKSMMWYFDVGFILTPAINCA